ncbi:MAG: hypothetical protein HZB38_11090 [Planctomycetes bacterium]|nr:hypothetical protein [Planctomycetota bacterium]
MRFIARGMSVLCGLALVSPAWSHGMCVGRTEGNQLGLEIEEPMPFPLAESTLPGISGFALDEPGIGSLEAPTAELNMLDFLSEIEFVLVGADPNMFVWNDRSNTSMAIGDAYYLGFDPFSAHPIWQISDVQIGEVFHLTLRLHDRTGISLDSDPIELAFTPIPEPSACSLLLAGALLARRGRR